MAVAGSSEELSWIVKEDAFGLRSSRRKWEGRILADVLKSRPTPCPLLSSYILSHLSFYFSH